MQFKKMQMEKRPRQASGLQMDLVGLYGGCGVRQLLCEGWKAEMG